MTSEGQASPDMEISDRQPYRWPRGPVIDTEKRAKQQQILVAAAVTLFVALGVLLYVIIARRLG